MAKARLIITGYHGDSPDAELNTIVDKVLDTRHGETTIGTVQDALTDYCDPQRFDLRSTYDGQALFSNLMHGCMVALSNIDDGLDRDTFKFEHIDETAYVTRLWLGPDA